VRRQALLWAVAAHALAGSSPSPASASAPATWKSRMSAAVRYAEHRVGTISFAAVDEAGRLHGYHARAVAPSASVLKAMLLVAYLRRADVRDRDLASWERDLLGPMIRRSDNTAATRMVGLVSERGLNQLADAAGMEHFRLHMPIWGASEITPRGQALFFDRIDSLVPRRHRAYAMHLLATVVSSQRWGVGRVPHGRWHLYFKGGWGSGTGLVDHQVALYDAAGERFSLALFTLFDPDHEYGKETLRGLAARLLTGVPRPQRRLPKAERAVLDRGYVVTTRRACKTVSIRPRDWAGRSFSTGAPSCAGFRLASAGPRVLWTWREGDGSHLAAAAYGDASASALGIFDDSDKLGALAGSGSTLAYQHGDEVTVLGGPDCSAPPGAVLAAGGGRVATALDDAIEVRDGTTCGLVRSLTAAGSVTTLALRDDLAVSLSLGAEGRRWLERFRISTGERLGRTAVAGTTMPALAVRAFWIVYRTTHAIRALSVGSGRTWTIWRPARRTLGAAIWGRRIVWVENHNGSTRLWSLRLPRAT
jgi:Beta-lactamase enzyme family